MTKPTVVIAGKQHLSATSFSPKKQRNYEDSKGYRDQGIVWVSPTRGKVYTNVVCSWLMLQWPMNQFRSQLIATEGFEVGAAYNTLFDASMNRRELRKAYGKEMGDTFADAPFVFTSEEDNVLPPNAAVALLAAIFKCPDCGSEVGGEKWKCKNGHKGYDAVSGLYFVKTDPPVPMAFGTPNGHKKLDFKPRSVSEAIKKGQTIEVNGIAMGCAIWRKALFKKVPRPWFRTTPNNTQDLYFCEKAKKAAKARFGVACSVRVGHYQSGTRELF